jgi:hypothetical protein
LSADELSADELSADELSADKLSADELSADKLLLCLLVDYIHTDFMYNLYYNLECLFIPTHMSLQNFNQGAYIKCCPQLTNAVFSFFGFKGVRLVDKIMN